MRDLFDTNQEMRGACHRDQLMRLNRISGQVAGIARMVEEGRYCMDILVQLRAARAALKKVEGNILRRHLQHCVAQSMTEPERAQEKVEELMRFFDAEKD